MPTARTVTVRGATIPPDVADLPEHAQADYDAREAAAPAVEAAQATVRSNRETLRGKAQQALADNAAYLAIPSPSSAQTAQQVARLTRSQSALIRVVLGRLDSTDGT